VYDHIKVYCDSHGVWYLSTRSRLINAGIATAEMFPAAHETWRGNGLCREPGEPLWSVQKTGADRYKVMWGLCVEAQTD
jgi:hypothetical protein